MSQEAANWWAPLSTLARPAARSKAEYEAAKDRAESFALSITELEAEQLAATPAPVPTPYVAPVYPRKQDRN